MMSEFCLVSSTLEKYQCYISGVCLVQNLELYFYAFTLLKVKVKVKSLSGVRRFATRWTVAHQAPPSMGFSRQEYWSRLPFPSPGDLPDPGIELKQTLKPLSHQGSPFYPAI